MKKMTAVLTWLPSLSPSILTVSGMRCLEIIDLGISFELDGGVLRRARAKAENADPIFTWRGSKVWPAPERVAAVISLFAPLGRVLMIDRSACWRRMTVEVMAGRERTRVMILGAGAMAEIASTACIGVAKTEAMAWALGQRGDELYRSTSRQNHRHW